MGLRSVVAAVVMILLVWPTCVAAQDGEWWENLGAARSKARAERRPLLVLFVLEGCPECARMQRSLRDPRVVSALEPFVKVQIEYNEQRDLALRYHIEYTPTLLVYVPADNFSTCRERHVGALSASSLCRLAERIIDQCGGPTQATRKLGQNAEAPPKDVTTQLPVTASWLELQRYLSARHLPRDDVAKPTLQDVYRSAVNYSSKRSPR